jgi:hypothetical protein
MPIYQLLLLLFLIKLDFANAIEITKLTPTPNYYLTKNTDDLKELTDGLVYLHPAWKRTGSVGWKDASSIKLDIYLPHADKVVCQSGVLKIYSGKNDRSGVALPRRIDIYEQEVHLKEVVIDNDRYEDDQAHIISTELEGVKNQLTLVIHSNGRFLMLDEVAWEPGPQCLAANETAGKTKTLDVMADSKRRLIEGIEKSAAKSLTGKSHFIVWFADPWGRLPVNAPEMQGLPAEISQTVSGLSGSKLVFVIGISGGCYSRQNYHINQKVTPELEGKFLAFQIQKVLTFDGSTVYDPLVPLKNNTLPCSLESATYLWFSIDLTGVQAKSNHVMLDITTENGENRHVRVNFRTSQRVQTETCKLYSVNWAYPQDKPIWSSKTANYQDLIDHGINVFVVPPSLLSLPQSDKPGGLKLREIVDQMNAVLSKNAKAEFLFFMAVDRWQEEIKNMDDNKRRLSLKHWIQQLDTALGENGFRRNQWALYPVDEPVAEKMESLIWSAKIIKAVNKQLRVYANPIAVSKNSVTIWQLIQLEPLVDILQPSFRLVAEQKSFFINLNKPWWIYDNPPAPVKSAEPNFYRALALKSWALGAQGTGFWSYSDTSKSSAWDDFDGRRPDWAIVYEGKDQVVSSRRWEAFAQGIADYDLLCNMSASEDVQMKHQLDNLKLKLNSHLQDSKVMVNEIEQFVTKMIVH